MSVYFANAKLQPNLCSKFKLLLQEHPKSSIT